ncbi:MAG: hypothetical protein MUF35_03635 [Candidatus Nanopelagicales bacterium]|nr:hypothetical protein [Candidatus Nanopelagicales bacterium]
MAKKRVHRPPGYGAAPASPRPATSGRAGGGNRPGSAAPVSPARSRLEAFSAPILLRMKRLPGWLIPVLLGVMLFVGLVVPARWGGILLVVIGGFLLWLTAVSWPAVSPGSRLLRMVVNLGVLALGVAKMAGLLA